MFVTHFLFSGEKDQVLSEAAIEDILEQKERIREPAAIEVGEYFQDFQRSLRMKWLNY